MAVTYKEYIVQPGDHLMAIALAHLGSKARFTEILDAQGKPLADPDKIKPGDVLRIPVAAAPTPPPKPYFEYTVQPGDHLMAIALKYLGSKARYTEILDAQGRPLADPDKIKPGDVLRIPKP